MNLSKRCIICNTDKDISTSMSVSIDGIKYDAHICQADEEKAAPSAVRSAVSKLLQEFDELKAKAELLGYKLVPISQALQHDSSKQQPQPAKQSQKQQTVIKHDKPPTVDDMKAVIVDNQVVEASTRPIHVPKRSIGPAGETEFQVVLTDDKEIQRRFRALNSDDVNDKGYNVHDCMMCGGSGKSKIGDGQCPKCKGRGIL